MGKLHKIRKAIINNPDEWLYTTDTWGDRIFCPATGAYYNKYTKVVKPGRGWFCFSYRNFVRAVIAEITKEVGITDGGHDDE